MDQLRAMLAETEPAPEKTEPKPATPEKAAEPAAEETLKVEPGTTEKKQVAEEEEPLPEGVQKKIAKEAERAARAQSAIDRAVSERKAKEAEAAKLTGKPGSEPAPITAPAENAKPTRPTSPKDPDFGTSGQTWGEYQDAIAKNKADHEAALSRYDQEVQTWMVAETRRTVEAEFRANQSKQERAQMMAEAIKEHGDGFPALVETLKANAPEGLQTAIGFLNNWSGVAAHLAKNLAQLKELAAEFDANPYQAIATLGRIQSGLKSATTRAAASPLPDPLATPGGKGTTGAEFDFEKSDFGAFKRHVGKLTAA